MEDQSKRAPIEIAWLEIADDPDLWRSFGYAVDDSGYCTIGGVEHRLIGADPDRRGLCGWAVTGLLDPTTGEAADTGSAIAIDGLHTLIGDDASRTTGGDHRTHLADHPNGVARVDHLVMTTPDTPRTARALESVGLERRGHRDSNSAGDRVHMTFFWVGKTLLELVGPGTPDPSEASQPARWSGIAYVSEDIDATASYLGHLSTDPKDAIQPGRKICALRKDAGSTVPMAFITPHVRRSSS